MNTRRNPVPVEDRSLVWFRQDLRLGDHPALRAAIERGVVIPVFIWDPAGEAEWAPGGASRWWFHHSIRTLASALETRGSRLTVRHGDSARILVELLRETGASAVFWNRRYEPAVMARDTAIKEKLKANGYRAESFNAALLFEPWTIQNLSGRPFQVFTPFWRHCLAQPEPPPPLPEPKVGELRSPDRWPISEPLLLESRIPWAASFPGRWLPGEAGAAAALERFCDRAWESYAEERNRPDRAGTSRLSPHLHFGELSPRQVLARLAARFGGVDRPDWRRQQFVTEVGWREFAHHLLYHFPQTPTEPLRSEFARFPWREDPGQVAAWERGRTGYPIVDAGLRELWTTGWMHNRVRMIVASFLVKDLRLPWQIGARWFWDTLVDADLAQNTLGWQWSAGCGADAAPYFRIFNPVTQGQKFDPEGAYVRQWVPELARLPTEYLHAPWEAPGLERIQAGVVLGRDYPLPMVDHAVARDAALRDFKSLRATSAPISIPEGTGGAVRKIPRTRKM